MRDPRRNKPLRHRGKRVGARVDRPVGRAPASDRQRNPHGRYRRAGLDARAATGREQGRRRGRGGAGAGAAQAAARQTATAMKRKAAAGNSADPPKANRRGAARLAAVQALYQMDIAGTGLNEILAQFESHWIGREVEGAQYLPAERAYFRELVRGVIDGQRQLDPLIDEALQSDWPLKRVEALLRALLRAGAYELECKRDVPARVIMAEYVAIADAFLDRDETGMVNAVLDQIARQLRATEFERAAG